MHTARPIAELRRALVTGELSARELIENALTTAVWRKTQGARVYLHLDPDAVHAQLDAGVDLTRPLGGLPASVKDCFDIAGTPSTAGSSFFASTRPVPAVDSEFAAATRHAGAVLMGKTNLNEFAYGITGENQHFGDCEIPTRPGCLTGGSSSGAAASVVEGSAVIGLGTDTGGSLRAPASFCGLVSFRASLERGKWGGCFPLAQSFDTMGWLCRHLSDVPAIGAALLGVPAETVEPRRTRIGLAGGRWLECCDPEIIAAQRAYSDHLRAAGFSIEEFDASMERLAQWLRPHFPEFKTFAVHKNATRKPDQSLAARLAALRKELGEADYQALVAANRLDLVLFEELRARHAPAAAAAAGAAG